MAIGTFTLRFIFYGLVALVPPYGSQKGLTVILPDAGGVQYSSDGCRMPEHYAAMFVSAPICVENLKHCGFSSLLDNKFGLPALSFGVRGSWIIRDYEIEVSLRDRKTGATEDLIPGIVIEKGLRGQSKTKIPAKDGSDVADFSWISSPTLGGEMDASCLEGKSQCPVASRLFLNGQAKVSVCHFVDNFEVEESSRKICPFEIRPLSSPSQEGHSETQAMADAVMAVIEVPREKGIVLTLNGLDHEVQPTEIILGAEDSKTIDVWIVNIPADIGGQRYKDCHDHSVDRHYELFYNLSKPGENGAPVPLAGRPVPHLLENEDCIDVKDLQMKESTKCPILRFVAPAKALDQGSIPDNKPACVIRQFVGSEGKNE